MTGEGHGTSKKAGKHQAAENVLNQLKAGIVPGEEKPEVKSEIPENVSLSYGGEINPVGTLQVSDTKIKAKNHNSLSGARCISWLAPSGLLISIRSWSCA